MIGENDIISYYKTSQTSKINLQSNDIEIILREGDFKGYHSNIIFTIYAILRSYWDGFGHTEEDYTRTEGGYKQIYGDMMDGETYNFTYDKRKRHFNIKGYWVFEDVEHLYDYEEEYPNNIKGVNKSQYEEFFHYILKGYQKHLKEKVNSNKSIPELDKSEYLRVRREVLEVMTYYVGYAKANVIVAKYFLSIEDIHKEFGGKGWYK